MLPRSTTPIEEITSPTRQTISPLAYCRRSAPRQASMASTSSGDDPRKRAVLHNAAVSIPVSPFCCDSNCFVVKNIEYSPRNVKAEFYGRLSSGHCSFLLTS